MAGYGPKAQLFVLPAGKWLSMAALLEAMITLCCSGVSAVQTSRSRGKNSIVPWFSANML